MEKLGSKLFQNIPEIKYLDERFKFIENQILRTNLSISFQYIIFLITLTEKIDIQGPVAYSISKNIILNTASIIEGSLHYLLETLIDRKILDSNKIMGKKVKYTNKKVLFKTEEGIEICGIHIENKPIKLRNNINFSDINRPCRRAKILTQKLFNEVEELRDKRNKIHLAGLKEVDIFYDKRDIQKSFDISSKIMNLVEEKLVSSKLEMS